MSGMEGVTSETNSHDGMLKALQRVKRIRKLEGTVVMKGGECLNAETLLGELQLNDFVLQIKALLAQYRNSGSPLNRALFNFDGGCFLVFNLSPYVFCFFFGELDDASAIERAGEEFLEEWKDSLKIESGSVVALPELKIEVAPPEEDSNGVAVDGDSAKVAITGINGSMPVSFDPLDPDSCDVHFKGEVKSLFTNVLSAKQVSRILEPEWKTIKSIPYDSRKEPAEKDFGKSLISRVRDRRIRK
ncbi:hypothetical protein N9Z18_01905 [Verrucomicrobiales bacterium]|jgi:hypothetical protein|nr:hypothetical protein [Verrucomicrobiales bacterium]MDB4358977.1 hypothetical protein [Verrucomicrobiales bacterium]|tara:strand:+ start:205 stop:939 length:735 start_codon:yes stop_codon:yes gene_type:complete